ncbi:MAG TPA: TonB family protein [Candidatus Acidoferrum sp.]|jgi:TonB family protein
MAPIVKDVENSAATTAPAAPATKPAQPVALEVPVTVNGARTVDGSDKREPFSESTKTVLIFGHGAVIRLASLVVPGQLLFVTNEKTKKEVVCQVVKSKNYRTVTGYVELEFTEPAVGFWGMRFPTDRISPAPATSTGPVAPAAHAPIQHPVAPASSAVPAPPKVVAAPPTPAAMKPAAPAPAPVKPVATAPPVAPPLAKPLPSKPPQPAASHAAPPVASHPAPSVPPVPPAFSQVAPKPPVTTATGISSNAETTSPATKTPKAVPTIPSADPTTDELKHHAARLQEQLSSMLFTQTPVTKAPAPAPAPEKPVAPRPDMIPTETVQKILQLAQPEVKPPSHVAPLHETRPSPTSGKSVPVSMAVEEVKIPAWLAPLARETDAIPTNTAVEDAAIAEANSSPAPGQEDALSLEGEAVSTKVQHPMFGDQLLGTSSEVAATTGSGGSKKGLFIGLAAAGLLVIGGGAWYAKQPGNALSGLSAPKPAATQTQTVQNSTETASKPAFRSETAAVGGPAPTSSNQPPTAKPLTPAPVPASSPAVNSTAIPAVSKETTSAPRNAPPVPQPKKPSLGDVVLATPSVNRAANSAQAGETAAPSIDASQPSSGEPFTLSGSHSKEPAAPLPIGGDVVSAKLLKSVPPVYPAAARTQRVGGDVKIDALIDVFGNVSTMKVISGPTLLHQAAMTALKQWKYEPAKLDGNPTPMHLTVIVQFRLQ